MTRRKGRYLWSAILLDELATSPTGIGALIVDSTDLITAAARVEVAFVGIRGWLRIVAAKTSSPNTLYMSIVMQDQEESATGAPMDPRAVLRDSEGAIVGVD